MEKQEITLEFPYVGDTTTKMLNPIEIKDVVIRYLVGQNDVRDDLCVIKDSDDNVIAVACVGKTLNEVHFFTEDDCVSDIPKVKRD